ncbi:hypothetical protein QYF36_011340 [Acer negundo]|nr:hypothetical protein QYF36_011340 [Acer negundo]
MYKRGVNKELSGQSFAEVVMERRHQEGDQKPTSIKRVEVMQWDGRDKIPDSKVVNFEAQCLEKRSVVVGEFKNNNCKGKGIIVKNSKTHRSMPFEYKDALVMEKGTDIPCTSSSEDSEWVSTPTFKGEASKLGLN